MNDAAAVLPGLMTPRSTTSESRRIEEVSARLKALKARVEGLEDGSKRNSQRPVLVDHDEMTPLSAFRAEVLPAQDRWYQRAVKPGPRSDSD